MNKASTAKWQSGRFEAVFMSSAWLQNASLLEKIWCTQAGTLYYLLGMNNEHTPWIVRILEQLLCWDKKYSILVLVGFGPSAELVDRRTQILTDSRFPFIVPF